MSDEAIRAGSVARGGPGAEETLAVTCALTGNKVAGGAGGAETVAFPPDTIPGESLFGVSRFAQLARCFVPDADCGSSGRLPEDGRL